MTLAQLQELRAATDAAIGALPKSRAKYGAVNFGDLHCVQAAWVTTDSEEAYAEVEIEEADPAASDFQQAIATELAKAGWADVRVKTEW